MTNYLPESYELYRGFPGFEVDCKTSAPPKKPNSEESKSGKKILLEKILGIKIFK